MYHDPQSGFLHLVKGYVPGVDLEPLWSDLPSQAKTSISEQLRTIFLQMRSLTPPCDFIGGACGGSLPDAIFETDTPDPRINGPFKAAEAVGSGLAIASQINSEQNGSCSWVSGYLSRQLPLALKDYEVNFTHGDLHMRNDLVEKVPMNSGLQIDEAQAGSSGEPWSYRVRAIVDWESAAWYPAYWEYASAVARFQRMTG